MQIGAARGEQRGYMLYRCLHWGRRAPSWEYSERWEPLSPETYPTVDAAAEARPRVIARAVIHAYLNSDDGQGQ